MSNPIGSKVAATQTATQTDIKMGNKYQDAALVAFTLALFGLWPAAGVFGFIVCNGYMASPTNAASKIKVDADLLQKENLDRLRKETALSSRDKRHLVSEALRKSRQLTRQEADGIAMKAMTLGPEEKQENLHSVYIKETDSESANEGKTFWTFDRCLDGGRGLLACMLSEAYVKTSQFQSFIGNFKGGPTFFIKEYARTPASSKIREVLVSGISFVAWRLAEDSCHKNYITDTQRILCLAGIHSATLVSSIGVDHVLLKLRDLRDFFRSDT